MKQKNSFFLKYISNTSSKKNLGSSYFTPLFINRTFKYPGVIHELFQTLGGGEFSQNCISNLWGETKHLMEGRREGLKVPKPSDVLYGCPPRIIIMKHFIYQLPFDRRSKIIQNISMQVAGKYFNGNQIHRIHPFIHIL